MNFASRVYAAAAHVSGMLTDITVTPAGGGAAYPGKVGFTEATEMVLGGEVIASAPTIRYASADLPVLAKGDSIAIGARTFKIGNIERLHDGSEVQASLVKP